GDREIHWVEIYRGDAMDIAFSVSDLFPSPRNGGPTIEDELSGDSIKVICRPSEWPRIEQLIREFDGRSKPRTKMVFRTLKGDPAKILPLLTSQNKNVVIKQGAQPSAADESLVEELHPENEQKPTPGLRPTIHPYIVSPDMQAWLEWVSEGLLPTMTQDA